MCSRSLLHVSLGILASLGILVLMGVTSQASAQPVAATVYGQCGVVLMQDGDVYLSGFIGPSACPWPQVPWVMSGNLFALAGRGPGKVIGMSTYSNFLAANGDGFSLSISCPGTPSVGYGGNIFELTGMTPSPGEEFSTFGEGGGWVYAVTSRGRVFKISPGCQTWDYSGTLPIGPTEADGKSWGSLKVRYR
jgi:hypothetical protein